MRADGRIDAVEYAQVRHYDMEQAGYHNYAIPI